MRAWTLSQAAATNTLDMTSSYWQVPLDVDAQEKSTFNMRSSFWKMEGVTLRADIRPCHIPEVDGTSAP